MTTTPLIPPDGLLRDWVDLYAPMSESPEEMHLAAALALLSAAIGWRAWISWGESREPVTLNVVLTGTSATARKTTTANTARKIAELAVNGDTPAFTVRDIGHTSDAGLLELVAPRDQDQARDWEREPPPGLLLIWDEIGNVLGRPGDVKGGDWLGRLRTVVMQLTGGRQSGMQLARAKHHPGRCAVSVLGTMTRAELEERMTTNLITDGFIGRLVLVPYGGRPRYLPQPPVWTSIDLDRRERIVNQIKGIVDGDLYGEAFTRFTRQATDLRADWYVTTARRLDDAAADGQEHAGAVQAAFGRLQAVAVKLAVIHAISRHPTDAPHPDLKITETDVKWGQWFAEYTLGEIDRLATQAQLAPGDKYQERVVDYLRSVGGGPVTRKQLMDATRTRRMENRERWRIIEQMHLEEVVDVQVHTTRGRDSTTIRLMDAAA